MSENSSDDAESGTDESGNDLEWAFHKELELILHDLTIAACVMNLQCTTQMQRFACTHHL